MAKLHVSTKYGITVHGSFFKQRLMSVCLVMEGYLATSLGVYLYKASLSFEKRKSFETTEVLTRA